MSLSRSFTKFVLVYSVIVSMLPQGFQIRAQDIVPNETVGGGSSAFAFRGSRKAPQAQFGSGYAYLGAASGRASVAGRSNAHVAVAAKKRRVAAALARKRAIAAAATKKLQLSNALTTKAEASLEANNFDLAITDFRAALVQNPKNDRAKTGLSEALTEKGIQVAGDTSNKESIAYLNEAISLDANNATAYAKLAAVYDAEGVNDKAAANYVMAVSLDPDLVTLNAPLGLIYVETGEVAKADECLRKTDAARIDTVDSRNLHGLVFYKRNMNSEALAAFDKTLELDGRNVLASYYRGMVYSRLNQPDNTIAALKKTLEIDPAFAPASYDLGVAYYNSGDYTDAASAYQETLKHDANNAQAHANLASTYRQLERYPDANAEYNTASNGIKTPDLYNEWGYCLGRTNEWDRSVERLTTARDLAPDAINSSNVGWAYYNAAQIDRANKDEAAAKLKLEKGKPFLQKAVELDAKLDAAYLNLGATYNGLGDFQAAVTVLNVALSLHSDWVFAANQLGLGYRGLNDMVNAVATFKRVVDLDGNYSYGLYNLGEAYNASGNKKEAKKINDRLRKLNPEMASRLNDAFNGRIPGIDVPKIPKIPRIPY